MIFRLNVLRWSLAAGVAALAGCAATQNQPTVTGLVPGVEHVGPSHATKAYGVGLADGVGYIPGDWGYQWCNGEPGSPSGCPDEVPGKRTYANHASGSENLETESGQPDGNVAAKLSVTQKLGTTSYLLYGEVDEPVQELEGVSGGGSISNGWWQDTLYITSQTLKNGTPVTIGVQAALDATETKVACDAAQNSFGELFIYSASITPASGKEFAISGGCVNGTFEYQLYGTSMQGTTATGTITTAVGDSVTIIFTATGEVTACQSKNQCVGQYVAELDGSYAFTITSITQGATYTTASGNTYQ
jgi:hypothetical protein